MLAQRFGEEWRISESDAAELAKAWVGWRQHYGHIVDPKTEALLHLVMVAGVIEAPRLMRSAARTKAAKTPQPPRMGPQVVPFGPPPGGAQFGGMGGGFAAPPGVVP